MQRMQYSDEQKAEALRLLAEVGKAEAGRRTGIPSGTIASWGSRHGVVAPPSEELAKANETKAQTLAHRRQALGEQFLSKAEALIKAVKIAEPALDRKRGIEAAREAAEAAQLLTGEPTSRVSATLGTDQERALAIVRQLDERRQAS